MTSVTDLKPGQTIVLIGDSVTDGDRGLPAYQPFGYGYVHFVANHRSANIPAADRQNHEYRVKNS